MALINRPPECRGVHAASNVELFMGQRVGTPAARVGVIDDLLFTKKKFYS